MSLGFSRVLIELKKHLELKGHHVDLVGTQELCIPRDLNKNNDYAKHQAICEAHKKFLLENADKYDIVDYDHEFLPYDRKTFTNRSIFVSRTVLLVQHLHEIKIPQGNMFTIFLKKLITFNKRQHFIDFRIHLSNKTLENADFINVPNHHDKDLLIKKGLSKEKIVVIPYGASKERVDQFSITTSTAPNNPIVAFVGTFDYRKGGPTNMPAIFKKIKTQIPNVKFKLLGCKGMFTSVKQILKYFPKDLHSSIEIQMTFVRDDLPRLLSDCSLGIFPSYIEGFPFGILEMQLAHLPVVAFNAPGAPMMIKDDLLVERGCSLAMANKIIKLLSNKDELQKMRQEARLSATSFTWESVTELMIKEYNCFFDKFSKRL